MRHTFKITREEAMYSHIENAIKLYFSQDYLAALILAAAAEDGTPDSDGPYLFKMAQEEGNKRKLGKILGTLNITRNWLKHCDGDKPTEIDFNPIETVFMLIRAISKYDSYYKKPDNKEIFESFIQHIKNHPDYKNLLTSSRPFANT